MIHNQCEIMFEIPLYHIKCQDWEVKKQKLLNLVNKSNLSYSKGESVKTSFHDHIEHSTSDIKGEFTEVLSKLLKTEIETFCNQSGLSFLRMTNSWFQTASSKDYHSIHNHGALGYTCIGYIQYDKELHSPTHFVAPYTNPLNGNIIRYVPNVDEGSLVFFPSMIFHYAEPNNSDIERTILSFNIDVEENIQLQELFSFIDNLKSFS